MRIIDEIKEIGTRLGHEKDLVTERVSDLLAQLAESEAHETFAIMRRLDPIVRAGPTTIVALDEDVREVLGDPARFTTDDYAAKLEAITGPFIVALDEPARHDHDRAAMDRAMTREDLPGLARTTYATARELVATGRGAGEIDVVAQLTDPVLHGVIAEYLGTPGPDSATQARWARSIFQEIYFNVGNLPSVRDRALADAALWRVHLDALIDARRDRLRAGEDDVPDDVLTRLLGLEGDGEPRLQGSAIRHSLLGTMMWWIAATSSAFARIVEELLHREDELAGAQAAARAADRELLAAYCWEAARFRPQNVALLRRVARDTTVAAGTERETHVAAGTTVIASTLSAMHDPAVVDEPERFRLDRPDGHHLLFGHGLHACYGQAIARAQIPALAAALLDGPPIRRARGDDGRLRFSGPFPSGLTVRFG